MCVCVCVCVYVCVCARSVKCARGSEGGCGELMVHVRNDGECERLFVRIVMVGI